MVPVPFLGHSLSKYWRLRETDHDMMACCPEGCSGETGKDSYGKAEKVRRKILDPAEMNPDEMKKLSDIRNQCDVILPRAKGAYLEDAPEYVFNEGAGVIELKEDGLRASMQLRGSDSLFVGRNRQDFLKGVERAGEFRHLNYKNPTMAKTKFPALLGTVLDGELTETFKQNGKYDKYTIERQEMGYFVGYAVWDCLFFMGKDIRTYPLRDRRKAAIYAVGQLRKEVMGDKIKVLERYPNTQSTLDLFAEWGVEGGIWKCDEDPIIPGQITHSNMWKLKTNKTVDAFIIGVTEGTSGGSGVNDKKAIPDGTAATFAVGMLDDAGKNIVQVGKMKNLNDDQVANGFRYYDQYKGKVVEMTVSGWDGSRFRWARFRKDRPDKSFRDCVFSDQVGSEGIRK
jgi:ATP-dependent DNA ligase